MKWSSNTLLPLYRDNEHQQGPPDAMIWVVEFGNYPCQRAGKASFTIQNIQLQFGEQLGFVYRHFPEAPNSRGWMASEAAEAAGKQGKFWEMHNALYQNSTNLEDANLVEYADELDLDIPQFLKEMTEHVHHRRIQADRERGLELGVEQTPTLFISVRHPGYQKFDCLLQTILELVTSSNFKT